MDDGTFFNLFDDAGANYGFWLTPKSIRGHGGVAAPSLILIPEFQSRSGQTRKLLQGEIIQAASVSLWEPNYSVPMFESGFQYFDPSNPRIVLSLTMPYLETLRSAAQLSLRFAAWLDSASTPGQERRAVQSRTEGIALDRAYWQTEVLPALGYPRVRLVPLTLDLPNSVQASGLATAEWKKTLDALSQALQQYQTYHVEPRTLIPPLRQATEHALRAWAHLWNLEIPENKKADALLQRLNERVKPCNAPNGIIPASAQYGKLCSTLVMIHDLLQLSNLELHAGTAGVYSLNEAETILYLTFGILRSLPDLWQTYPDSPTTVPPRDSTS